MSDMKFDESTDEFGKPPTVAPGTDWTGKLITWGIAKDRQQAQYVMAGIFVVIALLAFFVYRSA